MVKTIQSLIEEIELEAKYTARFTGRAKFSDDVLQAIRSVDRKRFVPLELHSFALDNAPLSIGHGQTISQPYMVALMTDLLDLDDCSIVLEIGTGSGYQTAILAELAKTVYTVERLDALHHSAVKRLQKMGYDNIEFRCGNGYDGWEDNGPYGGIIVTAAATRLPEKLLQQLEPGGRMVIPIGLPHTPQKLMLVIKDTCNHTTVDPVLDVAFVPLVESLDNAPHPR
ncbi:MAG: protein-L-isoaspartate(D-aspartate) O-methyltransferase [Gammaproteobacteria bacterium]|nr:protein-L-isoaspartate(D-aspartate) O-methyltransferase [Gammaproteobacteria bacterium]MDH5802332.1 protein-L-isoaspartate(D-aspartate) O-methyltransferase [Gammaproteobacteria bacterium]